MSAARERNHLLDGMRGVAAIMVMLFHFGYPFSLPMARSGYLAVDFFFILSGAVIARAYDRRLRDGWPLLKFLKTRLIRLYPLFLVGALLGLARIVGAIALHDPRAPGGVKFAVDSVANLLLLPTPMAGTSVFPLNTPGWSLSLEALVNIAFAALLFRFGRGLMVVALCGLALMVTALALHGSLDVGTNWASFYGGVGRVLWGFMVGVLIGRRTAGKATAASPATAITGLVLLVAVLAPSLEGAIRVGYDAVAAFLVFPILVYLGSGIRIEGRLAMLCGALGDLSYALYAVHYPLAIPLQIVLAKAHMGGIGGYVFAALLVIALAMILARLDAAAREYLSRMAKTRNSAPLTTL